MSVSERTKFPSNNLEPPWQQINAVTCGETSIDCCTYSTLVFLDKNKLPKHQYFHACFSICGFNMLQLNCFWWKRKNMDKTLAAAQKSVPVQQLHLHHFPSLAWSSTTGSGIDRSQLWLRRTKLGMWAGVWILAVPWPGNYSIHQRPSS